MKDNDEIIAEWLGWKYGMFFDVPMITKEDGYSEVAPNYDDDSAAVALLPKLVERGYRWKLKHIDEGVQCWITIPHMIAPVFYAIKPTIAAAITTAILTLIEKETPCPTA